MTTVTKVGLQKFGVSVEMIGCVYAGENRTWVVPLPGETLSDPASIEILEVENWEEFMRQLDLQETEVLARAKDGTATKAMLRKSARRVDTDVSWRVYRRDGYACRYCGRNDGALTIDHVITWENGGPTTEANLVSACRRCNRVRGNMPYEEWLQCKAYKTVTNSDRDAVNRELLGGLDKIEVRLHRVKR